MGQSRSYFAHRGQKRGKELENIIVAIQALEYLPRKAVFSFLKVMPADLILAIIKQIRQNGSSVARDKVGTFFLIEQTLQARMMHPNEFQTMLNVCVVLLRQEFQRLSDKSVKIGQIALELYGLVEITDRNKGAIESMVRDCGRRLDKKTMRLVLNCCQNWIDKPERVIRARQLLCTGYVEENGAELAFVILEGNEQLSSINVREPYPKMIETFKQVLDAVNVENDASVRAARAMFWQVCSFLGEKQAKETVLAVRPDLAGQFLDDSGHTFGKKAE